MSLTVDELLGRLDGRGEAEREAVGELRARLGSGLPAVLRRYFHEARRREARVACVYYCMFDARTSEDAVALGREALRDRSRIVRYRACMLLAYALKREALPDLRRALETWKGQAGTEDIAAAIDAIEHQNHHYFIDREHTGKMTLDLE